MIRILPLFLWVRAFWELCRYDLIDRTAGFQGNYNGLRCMRIALPTTRRPIAQDEIAKAVERACMLYWKPVLCLQRAIVTARLLRCSGWKAEVVIGYRPMPFAGHAWVEVEGTAMRDARVYQQQLLVLERIGAAGAR